MFLALSAQFGRAFGVISHSSDGLPLMSAVFPSFVYYVSVLMALPGCHCSHLSSPPRELPTSNPSPRVYPRVTFLSTNNIDIFAMSVYMSHSEKAVGVELDVSWMFLL